MVASFKNQNNERTRGGLNFSGLFDNRIIENNFSDLVLMQAASCSDEDKQRPFEKQNLRRDLFVSDMFPQKTGEKR